MVSRGLGKYCADFTMRKRLGEDAYNMLAVRASIVCKPDMEAVLLYLKGKLKEVGDEL